MAPPCFPAAKAAPGVIAQNLINGEHRDTGEPAVIATLADAHDVTLIHYDADFEIAAEVLPFRHQWVLERGTI